MTRGVLEDEMREEPSGILALDWTSSLMKREGEREEAKATLTARSFARREASLRSASARAARISRSLEAKS